jgi:hypothetical protein
MADEKLTDREEALAQRLADLLLAKLDERDRARVSAAGRTDTPLPVEHQDPPTLKTR